MNTNKKLRLLAVAAALTLPVWAAATAAAAPNCDKLPEDHPACTADTSTTTTSASTGNTCAESVEQGHLVFTETDGFAIVVDPGEIGCVDWTTTIETEWLVTVDPSNAKGVYFNVRSSHPGDFCWLDSLTGKDLRSGLRTLTITHANGPLADGGPLPISTVAACGGDDGNGSFVFTVGPSGKPSPVAITLTAAG